MRNYDTFHTTKLAGLEQLARIAIILMRTYVQIVPADFILEVMQIRICVNA